MKEIKLEALPYAEDALAPAVSAKTISFHYGKHHAGYVKTLNGLIAGTPYEGLSLEEIVRTAAARGDAAALAATPINLRLVTLFAIDMESS